MRTITSIGKLVAALIITQLAGVIGSVFTSSAIPVWYASLEKPWFTPPSWVFAPVWTTLYLLMGIALYLVWARGLDHPGVTSAIGAFSIQLVLNVLWSYLFFGLQSPLLGLVEILLLWVSIAATIILFYRVSRVAAVLLIPYIVWVTVATFLTYYIWILNP